MQIPAPSSPARKHRFTRERSLVRNQPRPRRMVPVLAGRVRGCRVGAAVARSADGPQSVRGGAGKDRGDQTSVTLGGPRTLPVARGSHRRDARGRTGGPGCAVRLRRPAAPASSVQRWRRRAAGAPVSRDGHRRDPAGELALARTAEPLRAIPRRNTFPSTTLARTEGSRQRARYGRHRRPSEGVA